MASHKFIFLLYLCLMTNLAQGMTYSTAPPTTPATSVEQATSPPPTPPPTTQAITHQTHSVVHNLHCFSCKYVSNLQNCRYAKRCPTGSSCLTGQLTSGLYYMDCVPTPACMVLPTQLETSGTVTFLNNKFKHFQCCTQPKCNKNQVQGVGR